MSLGNSNIIVQQRRESTAGLLTGAQNGVGLNGTIVELGFPLIQDTDIDQEDFEMNFLNFGLPIFTLDPLNGFYRLGDLGGAGNQTNLTIQDANQSVAISANAGDMLSLDNANGLYSLGDLGPINNATQLRIDDTFGFIALGDITGANNGTNLNLNDTIQTLSFENTVGQYLLLDAANFSFTIGDFSGTNNNTYLLIDDTAQRIELLNATNNTGMTIDANAGQIQMVTNANVELRLDDATNTIFFNNGASNVGLNINGVAGFTGTVTPVNTITVNNGIVTNVA